MNEHELAARDAQRDIGAELLEAVRQVKTGNVGRGYQVSVPRPVISTLSDLEPKSTKSHRHQSSRNISK